MMRNDSKNHQNKLVLSKFVIANEVKQSIFFKLLILKRLLRSYLTRNDVTKASLQLSFLNIITVLFLFQVFSSCHTDEMPKPRGYFRIDLPEKKYVSYVDSACSFGFEIPTYSVVVPDKSSPKEPCWINIEFPMQRATIHLSYKNINNNLKQYTEDTRSLAYKHTVKADAIDEEIVIDSTNKVYGVIYHIAGNAASSLQFYLTDSTNNFIRGALYFNAIPNKDSIAPVSNFINADISHLIETFKWM